MAFNRFYRCPDCEGTFKFMHVLQDDPPPDRCELCGSWMNLDIPPEPVFVPQAPAVRSGKAKAVDDVYYGMEDSSRLRAEMMAQVGGGSASDYAHTHITNMKDNSREGDIAYVPPPPNPVTQMMAAAPQVTGHQANAMAFAEANRHGVGAYAGEGARKAVVSQHHQQVASLVGAGRIGSYKSAD
jgi:hypothetical protein